MIVLRMTYWRSFEYVFWDVQWHEALYRVIESHLVTRGKRTMQKICQCGSAQNTYSLLSVSLATFSCHCRFLKMSIFGSVWVTLWAWPWVCACVFTACMRTYTVLSLPPKLRRRDGRCNAFWEELFRTKRVKRDNHKQGRTENSSLNYVQIVKRVSQVKYFFRLNSIFHVTL